MTEEQLRKATRLFQMPLSRETDVVLCRNRARLVAEALKVDKSQQVKFATAVSEIARNAFRYAEQGEAKFYFVPSAVHARNVSSVVGIISDSGPGIADLPAVLSGVYRSKTGMGAGIRGAQKLMDHVDITTGPTGTSVELWLGLGARLITADDLNRVVHLMGDSAPVDPLEELATQNHELVSTLDQIGTQREELEQINNELSETNRGVVALYDELETVHRVGRAVASKLDLDSLLSAITDATTDLSGAELGAFFQVHPQNGNLIPQCFSGPLNPQPATWPAPEVGKLVLNPDDDIFRFDEDGCPDPFGSVLHLRSLMCCPLRDNDRNLMGVLVFGHREPNVFSERTERILPSVAIQASIGITNAKLYRHIQSANEAKERFLAVLSHELRTPLNPVFAILTSLEENPNLPPSLRPDLVIMRRNLQLEATLIDDLLDLTRISQGKMTLKMEPLDVHTIVESVAGTCHAEIERKKLRLTCNINARHHHISGESVRIQQALWNFVTNAIKFTPEGGTITIASSNPTADEITVSVTDSGCGLEKPSLERIFQAFEQENILVTSRYGGLGLGLAISKGITEAHRGRILAESEGLGTGARFSMTFPVIIAPLTAEPTPIAPPPTAARRENLPLRILMVDDHEDTRVIMSRMLELRGYVVTGAGNCAEALAQFQGTDIDLVISDLGLPDGHGHDLMRQLREIKPVRSIALSGYGMETDVEQSKAAGFSCHLVKPVDFGTLDQAIARLAAEIQAE